MEGKLPAEEVLRGGVLWAAAGVAEALLRAEGWSARVVQKLEVREEARRLLRWKHLRHPGE